jgi:hypothetical protein
MAFDWNARNEGTAEERATALRDALGLRCPRLDGFLARLDEELLAEDWGYGRLVEIEDVELRALVSDQLHSVALGVRDHLQAAHLAAHELDDLIGPNGMPFHTKGATLKQELRAHQALDRIGRAFGAVGSTVDCLAAVLIVVARLPLSIQGAAWTRLASFDPEGRGVRSAINAQGPSAAQRACWDELRAAVAAAVARGPRHWMPWALATRNARTHRGRTLTMFFPRPVSSQLALPPPDHPLAYYRFDPHLRRRPWLPDIESLYVAGQLPAAWIAEPAQRTIEEICRLTTELVEGLLSWADAAWISPSAGVVAPSEAWTLAASPEIEFAGMTGAASQEIVGAFGGAGQEWLKLAERLRRRRQGEPDRV